MKNIVLAVTILILGAGQVNLSSKKDVIEAIATEVHITSADGTRSLLDLIKRDPHLGPIPNRKVSSFFFIIDAQSDYLIVQGTDSQPPGFQLAIKPGDTKTFPIVKLPVNAEALMSGFMIRTNRVCNFFVRVEFQPE